jgi:hypothetical protein
MQSITNPEDVVENPEIEVREAKIQLLRTLIIFQICVVLVVAFAGDWFVSYQYSFDNLSPVQMITLTLFFVLGLGVLIGLIGLWLRWRPARLIFTLCTILMPALLLSSIPIEITTTRAGEFFEHTGSLAAGATIALLYFGGIEDYFGKSASDT